MVQPSGKLDAISFVVIVVIVVSVSSSAHSRRPTTFLLEAEDMGMTDVVFCLDLEIRCLQLGAALNRSGDLRLLQLRNILA